LSKKIVFGLSLISLIVSSGCSFTSEDSSLRPRTIAEEEAITNAWYPVTNQECQLLVDSLNLIQAAIGSSDLQHLSENMEEIKRNLEQAGQVTSIKVLDLSLTTSEPSIREYAIEGVPIFASLGSIIATDSEDFTSQIAFLTKLRNLTDKVPDACKS
jgi:hypothetical protein